MIINESVKLNEAEEFRKYDLSGEHQNVRQYLDDVLEDDGYDMWKSYRFAFDKALSATGGNQINYISLNKDSANNYKDYSQFHKHLVNGKKIKSIENGFIKIYTDGEFKYFFETSDFEMTPWIPMAMYRKYTTR